MVVTWQELRDARAFEGLTQAELAEKLQVSTRTVVNWETEGRSVPNKSEYKVRRILGVAMEEARAWNVIIEEGPEGVTTIKPRSTEPQADSEIAKEPTDAMRIKELPKTIHARIGPLSEFSVVELLNELRNRALTSGEETRVD